jgi:sulfur carrier protein
MDIKLNGRCATLPQSQTLAEFLRNRQITVETRGVAVARNGSIVPRTSWEDCRLESQDEVEVIHAVAGG